MKNRGTEELRPTTFMVSTLDISNPDSFDGGGSGLDNQSKATFDKDGLSSGRKRKKRGEDSISYEIRQSAA